MVLMAELCKLVLVCSAVVAREAGVEGESWRALVMGTAETEVARSLGAGRD